MSLKHNRYEWEGPYAPSSEWHFHRAILQSQPSYRAVVHTHSTYSTVLSIANRKIPACHYMIAAFGGSTVRCAKYATFGTEKLSKNILKAMRDRSACLLANHGMVVAGANLDKAMWAAVELETLSKQYYLASRLKKIAILSDAEIKMVVKKFANYGPKDKNAGTQSGPSLNGQASENNDLLDQQEVRADVQQRTNDGFNRPAKTEPNIKLPVNK